MRSGSKKVISLVVAVLILFASLNIQASDLTATTSASDLRKSISTVNDAINYIDKRYSTNVWMSMHYWQNPTTAVLRSGEEILNSTEKSIGRSDICTAIAYLLNDDMKIGNIYGFRHFSSDDSLAPIMAANYIYQDGKYKIFDPVVGMAGDSASRNGSILPEATVPSLNDYTNQIISDSILKNTVDSLYCIDGGQGITFTDKNGWTTVTKPSVSPIYANEGKNLTEEQYMEKKYGHIKPENVSKYKISTLMGGLTMTSEEAKALVGKEPEVIKEKVRTAGDMFLYMLASRMLLKDGDDTIEVNGHQWHYNQPAYDTLAINRGNCGRMANLSNYLLEGDYDEVGFILHSYTGHSGGHVYNYIKYQGKYYIVDFSSFLFNNYDVNSQFNIIALDKLEDYGTRWKECYGGLAEIIAHTSPGTHLPNVWEGDYCYYPEGSKFTIIMQTHECMVGTLPCNSEALDWTKPQVKQVNAVLTPQPEVVTPNPTPTPQPIGTPVSTAKSTVGPTATPTVVPTEIQNTKPTQTPIPTIKPTPTPKPVILNKVAEVSSVIYKVDVAKHIVFIGTDKLAYGTFVKVVVTVKNGSYVILRPDKKTQVHSGNIVKGMFLKVTSQDKKVTNIYSLK